MSDERFEQRLRQAARDYHAPAEVPRDAMWAAIDAARRGRAGAIPPALRRRPLARAPWLAAAAGIAAVLAIGIAIGRWTARLPGGALPGQAIAGVPTAGVPAPGDTTRPTELPRNVAALPSDDTVHRPDQLGSGVARRATPPDAVPRLAHAPRGRSASAAERVAVATPTPLGRQRRGATGAAAARHLAEVEVLLTAFRADARAGAVDRDVAEWARDLLGTTRLLIDSPAGDDARLRRLLGDLELVLAQIARLPARSASDDEVQIIDEAVRQRDVIARVRSALPAGARAGS